MRLFLGNLLKFLDPPLMYTMYFFFQHVHVCTCHPLSMYMYMYIKRISRFLIQKPQWFNSCFIVLNFGNSGGGEIPASPVWNPEDYPLSVIFFLVNELLGKPSWRKFFGLVNPYTVHVHVSKNTDKYLLFGYLLHCCFHSPS